MLTESGELRALDDRSLNGLFVNGEQVDWAPLTDGDELEIGCYRLSVLVSARIGSCLAGRTGNSFRVRRSGIELSPAAARRLASRERHLGPSRLAV